MPVKQHNRILAALSHEVGAAILRQSTHVSLPVKTTLEKQGEKSGFAYLLTSGVASIVIELDQGGTAEVGLVGNEGVVGSVPLYGPANGTTHTFMQVAGYAYRVPFEVFKATFQSSSEFRKRIHEFTQQQQLLSYHLVACGLRHKVEARLARWLLMIEDRAGSPKLTLSQEFISEMLAIHRPTLNVAMKAYEHAGLIKTGWRRIEIVDQRGLREAACECYFPIRQSLVGLYSSAS